LQILAIALAIAAVCGLASHPNPQRTLAAPVMQMFLKNKSE